MAHDRERRKGKGAAADRRRVPKKKTSILTSERIDWIDYKDVNLLRRFMSERAKIRARRVTGNSQQQQVAVAKAIRIAREMALLPYSVRQVTQRSKGGRRDRGDRGDRGELRAPTEMPFGGPDAPPVAPTDDPATEEILEASDGAAASESVTAPEGGGAENGAADG